MDATYEKLSEMDRDFINEIWMDAVWQAYGTTGWIHPGHLPFYSISYEF